MVEKEGNLERFMKNATITSLISGGRRKIHATFEDKTEMIEEYDIKTHELIVRKWKKKQDFRESSWNYEVGEAPSKESGELLLAASSQAPIFIRKDTDKEFQFRIRNLNYPEDVFIVETDEEKQQIVVRTTNKKYFKRIDVPDLKRFGGTLKKGNEKWVFKNNTLIISYPKPEGILKVDAEIKDRFNKFNAKKPKEGDIECVQQ